MENEEEEMKKKSMLARHDFALLESLRIIKVYLRPPLKAETPRTIIALSY